MARYFRLIWNYAVIRHYFFQRNNTIFDPFNLLSYKNFCCTFRAVAANYFHKITSIIQKQPFADVLQNSMHENRFFSKFGKIHRKAPVSLSIFQ